MIITDVIEVNKNRYKIYLDYEFAFVLYKGELHKYNIVKEQELDLSFYNEITHEVIPKRAKLRAMNLLTKRPYTEEKLRQKLREGFYSEDVMDIAIEYVKKYGYIDDYAYANDYIIYHMSMESIKQIELKLLNKGINHTIIEQCLMNVGKEESEKYELEQIHQIITKKYKNQIPDDLNDKAKMMSFLNRKGYSFDLIKRAISYYDNNK